MSEVKEKTHWLKNPNKNYLGHWDLPESGSMCLTIKSVAWEDVEIPQKNYFEKKRVIRFKEDVKPMICNETNAKMISKVTGDNFFEDSLGKKISIKRSRVKASGQEHQCIRVADIHSSKLNVEKINKDHIKSIKELLSGSGKSEEQICTAYKVNSLLEININQYNKIIERLEGLKNANN